MMGRMRKMKSKLAISKKELINFEKRRNLITLHSNLEIGFLRKKKKREIKEKTSEKILNLLEENVA